MGFKCKSYLANKLKPNKLIHTGMDKFVGFLYVISILHVSNFCG